MAGLLHPDQYRTTPIGSLPLSPGASLRFCAYSARCWACLTSAGLRHVAKIREDIDTKRAEHDADRAEKIAEKREDDAAFAVQFAYAAIEEAEYAVLDAALARAEADEASAA